jgi:predicted NBD/HSP70 family sugar kinase
MVQRADELAGVACTVGVGAPGSPNPRSGLHRNSNLICMNGRTFRADLTQRVGRQVAVSNDANCMALSEAVDGAGEGHVVFGVIVGTGVGGGVVIGKRVLEGAHGIAGEWGHNPMPGSSDAQRAAAPCYCGRSGCIEQFLSGPALMRRYHAQTVGQTVPGESHQCQVQAAHHLEAAARQGDAVASAILHDYAEHLARALGTIVNVIDPDTIVLAGGLSNIHQLAARVQGALPQYAFSDECRTRVAPAAHGDSSGVRGAAWLGRSLAESP